MTTFTGTLSAGATFVIWGKCVFKSHDTLKTLRELLNHGNAELLFISRLQLNSDVRDLNVPNLKISELTEVTQSLNGDTFFVCPARMPAAKPVYRPISFQ